MPSFFCVYCLQCTQLHSMLFGFLIYFVFTLFLFSLVFMNLKTNLSKIICLEESFFHCLFMRPLSEIVWLWVCGSSPWLSVLGHWSTWLSYDCPTVLWLQYKQVLCITFFAWGIYYIISMGNFSSEDVWIISNTSYA